MIILRFLLATAAGLATAFALVIAVEVYSSIVHPTPKDFDHHSMSAMCAHVANYPHWVLATVVLLWGGTVFVSTWIATRISNPWAGVLVTAVLGALLVLNLSMLPYTPWFKIVMPIGFAVGCWLGIKGERGMLIPRGK